VKWRSIVVEIISNTSVEFITVLEFSREMLYLPGNEMEQKCVGKLNEEYRKSFCREWYIHLC